MKKPLIQIMLDRLHSSLSQSRNSRRVNDPEAWVRAVRFDSFRSHSPSLIHHHDGLRQPKGICAEKSLFHR